MKEITLSVNGMMCEGCENRVKNSLKNIDEVVDVTADHNTGKVVIFTENENIRNQIEETIEDIGYEIKK